MSDIERASRHVGDAPRIHVSPESFFPPKALGVA
jgi:hypothetical protein